MLGATVGTEYSGPHCERYARLPCALEYDSDVGMQEPVIYIGGRPHVLRNLDRPLQNVEATGITTDIVESMEIALKRDVQNELRKGGGKILLHDEIEESPGNYRITPLFETVPEDDVMTPRDVFELIIAEGYQVRAPFTSARVLTNSIL